MNRHAFRSVCSRTRPELEQASTTLQNYVRQFSTTPAPAADERPKPSLRERTQAAASKLNSLARERSPVRNAAPTTGTKPKVIDVKSLPRGGALRGGFSQRGRGGSFMAGGFMNQPRTASPTGRTGTGFRGGARGGKRGGGRGGAKRPQRRRFDEEEEGANKGRRRGLSKRNDDITDGYDRDLRFGVRTPYNVESVTVDTLAEFAPIVPSSTTGRTAAVMQNLSVLGTAEHVGQSPQFLVKHFAREVEADGLRFFADPADKDAAETYLKEHAKEGSEAPSVTGAEDAVRTVVTKRALQGEHEAPKFTEGPLGLARNWHLRAETYAMRDVDSFEAKLKTVLAGKKRQAKAA